MKCIPVPPALKINEVLYKNREMPVHVRVEQRIVWNLMLALKAAGFEPLRVNDGDENTRVNTWKAAMERLFNLDDAIFSVSKNNTGFWIKFVFGNGIDVVSDYSYSGRDTEGFNKLMDEFKPELFA